MIPKRFFDTNNKQLTFTEWLAFLRVRKIIVDAFVTAFKNSIKRR